MKKLNDEDVLKKLFEKISLEKAPEDFTLKVMEQIMVQPELENVKITDIEWWWLPIGFLGLISMYLTGVFTYLYNLAAPYFIQHLSTYTKYLSFLSDLFPSKIIVLPSSLIIPVIISGIIAVLFFEIILKMQFKRFTGY